MSLYPSDLRYSKEHEWVRVTDDGTALVGITHYAQQQLGDVVYIDLPLVGAALEQSKRMGEIESVKAVSDLFSPASGEVLEVNESLLNAPEAVNRDPYGKGWMVRLRLKDKGELAKLMDAQAYQGMLGQAGH